MTKTTNKNAIWKRIKLLVLLQAGEKFRSLKTNNKKNTAFKIFLSALAAVAVTAGLYFLFNYIKSNMFFTFDDRLFTTVIFLTQIIGIITCTGSMMAVLYNGKENHILMAFPCKYNEIFVSKIIVFTLDELKKSCFFVLPFLLSYGVVSGGGLAYWLQMVPTWIFMATFPVLISAILSIPLIFVKKFLENHALLYGALFAVFLVGVFALIVYGLSFVPTPVRLVAVYNAFMTKFQLALAKINKFALFYNFIGKSMFGRMVYLYLPLSTIIYAAAAALCFLVAMPFYFKAASSSSENSVTKKHKVHERRDKKQNKANLFLTFFRKEIKLMLRSSSNIIAAVSIVFVFPILSYVMNFIVAGVRTNLFGNYMTIGFNIMITLSLLSTYNANCAQAISSEGSEFSVLKAAPSNTMLVTWAKLAVTMIVDLLAVGTMCGVLAVTTKLTSTDILLMVVTIVFVSLGNILWSFQLDITNPKVNDYAVKGDAVVDNPNVAKALVIGFIFSTITGVISLLLLIDDYKTGWLRIVLIAAAFFLIRLYLYMRNLKVYFNDIQG